MLIHAFRRDAEEVFLQRVGVLQVEERVSCADACVWAPAARLPVPLVTTDYSACDAVERQGRVRLLW
jgi:hypothetical protein